MSDNYRKNISDYTLPLHAKGTKVYRPNSMRQVSAEKELNRLQSQVDSLHREIDGLKREIGFLTRKEQKP